MNKRNFIVGLLALPITGIATAVEAATSRINETIRYKVKKGSKRIRVRSWRGNDKVIDIYINVEPGQTFVLEAMSE